MNEIMNKNELLSILEDWNFWKKDLETGFARDPYLDVLEKRLPGEQIKVITGARRSGKSFIMRQLAKWLMNKKGVDKSNILIVNFEDPRFTYLNTAILQQAFAIYLETYKPQGKIFVFLDEIQEIPGWEKWVRTAQELQKANIVISGSNSKLLSSKLATVLTGRHLDITVMPLSFAEFLKFRGVDVKDEAELIRNGIESGSFFEEYLQYGSFPLVVLGEDKEGTLLAYYDDIVNKDLIKRYKVRKTEGIKSLIKFYLSNISRPVTFTSSGKFIHISPLSTERFSSYLETSYVVFFLKRFSHKVKEQEKSPRKVYAVDTGLANVVGFQFSSNLGRLAENLVFLELKRKTYFNPRRELYYWKSARDEEVDFVVKEGVKVKELIQVCWDLSDINTKKREIKSLLKALGEFRLDEGLVITDDFEGEEEYGEKKIRYIPIRKWFLLS